MKKILSQLLLIVVLAGVGYYTYGQYANKCSEPLAYSIGNFDPRFGISEQDFIKLAENTESVWESSTNKDLFVYDPSASFKINLIFDDRQQNTIDEQNKRSEIDTNEQKYRQKVADYDAALAAHNLANQQYEADLNAYDQRLKEYNAKVDYWNKNGGAPASDYNQLQKEKTALQKESARLETVRQSLNQKVAELNQEAAEINIMAQNLHLDVNAYNGKFGTSREFDQGNYTGKEINIFQFSGVDDLRLVLAHEMGHALGMDHVDDPQAIMYYLMDQQNIKNLQPAPADLAAIKKSCNL